MSPDEIAILRIELVDIEPLIWRRVAVPTSTNLQILHKVVQAAMGWLDYHLWEFEIGDVRYGIPDPHGEDWGRKVQKASATRLAKLLDNGIKEFLYTYDMGDNWEHRIILERVEPAKHGIRYPWFLGGERRCPPEDCGGLPGYYEFIDAIAASDKGRGSKKKKEALAWYGQPYDPDDIDEEQIKITLNRIAKSHRAGKAKPATT
ncbi:MAG: plasmid pRiA4b ORF-3 family protein [Rhodospirillaceae bacterium]